MSRRNVLLNEAEAQWDRGGDAEADHLCRRVLRDHPDHPDALHYLGRVHAVRGDFPEAARLLAQSVLLSPEKSNARCDLAVCYYKSGRIPLCIRELLTAISTHPTCSRAYSLLATVYYQLGRNGETVKLYRRWSRQDPTNPEVRHMLQATSSGNEPPERCSEEFLRSHFNGCADIFDERLVQQLHYRGHTLVASIFSRYAFRALGGSVLDAGCGTGLCGPLVKPQCGRLIGVDISEQMIRHAQRRGVYDQLIVADICRYLKSVKRGALSAILAADVFIYFGKLDCVLQSARRALESGGVLVLTCEHLRRSRSRKYRLEAHGRYSHSLNYVEGVLRRTGFQILHRDLDTIRFESSEPVQGIILAARTL